MKYSGLYQWSYLVIAVIGALGCYLALDFSRDGRYLPLLAGGVTFIGGTVLFIEERLRLRRLRAGGEDAGRGSGSLEGAAADEIPIRGILIYAGIILLYVVGLVVLGALLTSALFVGVLLVMDGNTKRWVGVVAAVVSGGTLVGLHYAIGLEYPTGLVFAWMT